MLTRSVTRPAVSALVRSVKDARARPAGSAVGPLVTGLGAYAQDTQSSAFVTYLGRPTDYCLTFFNPSSWSAFLTSIPVITTQFPGARCVWSVPIACALDNLSAVASGTYDSYYSTCADALVAQAVAGPIVIRLGWEFNLTSNNNRALTSGGADDSTNWKAAWRRVVGLFRAKSARFKFDWCPNFGTQAIAPDLCYPGDDVVDVIGMDVYFTVAFDSVGDGGVGVFNFRRDQAFGLQWQVDFAALHGKPMAASEWGINSNLATGYTALWIDWIKTHNFVYHMYWEGDHGASCRLTNGDNPAIAALYKDAFGKPRITSVSSLTGEVGTTMTLPLTAAKAVTWSIVGGAQAAQFTLVGSTLSLVAPSTAAARAVTIRALDSAGYFTDQAITFDVQAVYTFTNTEASAYVARMSVAPPRTLKAAIDNLTTVFKANGYASAKAIFIRAVHDSQAALLEFKGGTSSNGVNSPVFTAYRGFTGKYDGTLPAYVNVPPAVTSASPYVQNSATLLIWNTVEISTNSPAIGTQPGSIIPRNAGGSMSGSINDFSSLTAAVPSSIGVFSVIRSSASARRIRRNGVTLNSDTAGSNTLTAGNFLEDCSNPAFPDAYRLGFIWIGSALSDAQESAIVTGLQAYAAAVGAPI